VIQIDDLGVRRGSLPPRALGLVVEWATLHQSDLVSAWARAQAGQPLSKIEPLE
jgi:hypothetical protein